MFDIGQLRVTERESGVRYPSAIWDDANELQLLAELPEFAAAFPGVRTATERDIQEARDLGLPEPLLPFACESQPTHTDYYCCGSEDSLAVAVFAVDAVVADWPNLQSFVEWGRHQFAEQRAVGPGAAADGGA